MPPHYRTSHNLPWRSIFLSALACLIAGCNPGNRILEETIEQTYPLSPRGTVSIRNDQGSIHVYGSDIEEVRLEALKRAYSKQRLHTIITQVTARSGSVSIESIFPKTSRWGFSDSSGTIDYALLVPQGATIEHIQAVNGEIIIEGMRGTAVKTTLKNGRMFVRDSFCDLNFQIGHGALTILFSWWEQKEMTVDARIRQGNTVVFMPGNASFKLSARTDTGKAINDFTAREERYGDESRKIDKVVGSTPTATFRIHAIDGNIQISEQNP